MLDNLLVWSLLGLVAGWSIGELTRGLDHGGVGNIFVGLVGALFGGFLARAWLDIDLSAGLHLIGAAVSVAGAVFLVVVLRLVGDVRM